MPISALDHEWIMLCRRSTAPLATAADGRELAVYAAVSPGRFWIFTAVRVYVNRRKRKEQREIRHSVAYSVTESRIEPVRRVITILLAKKREGAEN